MVFCWSLAGVEVAASPPASHWACLQPGAQPLPKYWRLVASERPAVSREVRLYERSPDDSETTQACRVEYDKNGETSVLWFADHQRGFCRPRAEDLVDRLVASGLHCISLDSSDRLQQADQVSEAGPEQATSN